MKRPFINRQSLSVSPRGPSGCNADGADAKELNPRLECQPQQLDHLAGSDDVFVRIFALWCRLPDCGRCRLRPGGQRRSLLYLQEQLARLPYEFSNVRTFRNSLASIAAVFYRVLVASRGA
jgi:hypothetical protein